MWIKLGKVDVGKSWEKKGSFRVEESKGWGKMGEKWPKREQKEGSKRAKRGLKKGIKEG